MVGAVRLFEFDGVDDKLELIPLAARRALEHAGLKLELLAWQALPLAARRELTLLGSQNQVGLPAVKRALEAANPTPMPVEPRLDPPSDHLPTQLAEAFGPSRPILPGVWAGLSSLERYALTKVAESTKPELIEAAYAELVGAGAVSPHLAPTGGVWMVDVAHKAKTTRRAEAESRVSMNAVAFERLASSTAPKGDVLGTARLAGIMAAKQTSQLLPLCHQVALTHVEVVMALEPGANLVRVRAIVEAQDRTGVEMEAMVAASVASLTVYDMLKAIDRSMAVGPTLLLAKSGGKSGAYSR
jgi:cyclic pyranopterin phosphate synthase